MKHIKTLGLLALAVMALTAVVGTASASADKPTFTASSAGLPLNETTKSNHVFSVTGSNTTCKNISFAGNTEATDDTDVSIHPTFGECTAFGFAATVSVTNCKFVLDADGTVHLVRTDTAASECSIHIEVNNAFAKCKVTITEQTIAGINSYSTDPENPNAIIVKIDGTKNISDHVTESTGFCPLTVGTHTNAHYSGESTVTATGGSIGWDNPGPTP